MKDIENTMNEYETKNEGCIFLFSASMTTNYIIDKLFERSLDKHTMIDIGSGFEKLMDTVASWFQPKSNLKTVHRQRKKSSFAGKSKKEFDTFNKQKKIDLILDKISKSGYDSLTS